MFMGGQIGSPLQGISQLGNLSNWPYIQTMTTCPKCGYCPQCGQQKPTGGQWGQAVIQTNNSAQLAGSQEASLA